MVYSAFLDLLVAETGRYDLTVPAKSVQTLSLINRGLRYLHDRIPYRVNEQIIQIPSNCQASNKYTHRNIQSVLNVLHNQCQLKKCEYSVFLIDYAHQMSEVPTAWTSVEDADGRGVLANGKLGQDTRLVVTKYYPDIVNTDDTHPLLNSNYTDAALMAVMYIMEVFQRNLSGARDYNTALSDRLTVIFNTIVDAEQDNNRYIIPRSL